MNSQPYRGRPACIDCGFCGSYGCPNHAKCSPAVTFLRDALLTGKCQIRYNSPALRLVPNATGTAAEAVEYMDSDGAIQHVRADRVILAATAIESARLMLLSDRDGTGFGNANGLVGRNLTFHYQTLVIGVMRERIHGHRGRSVTGGMSDFRGVPNDPERPLGGIVEFATNADFVMQAEDAPQLTNRIDLDPEVRDVYGQPVSRITYSPHTFETSARELYVPKLLDLVREAGAVYGVVAPADAPSNSRHVMGTMRMGTNPATSVCDRVGKVHALGNVYCADGGLFPTSSGYNPTLTIQALALWVAANMVSPASPESVLREV